MVQFILGLQLPKGITHSAYNFRLNIQSVMCREHIFHRKGRYLFKGIEVQLRISGRKVGKQCIFINQITGEKITTFLIPKTHMPW